MGSCCCGEAKPSPPPPASTAAASSKKSSKGSKPRAKSQAPKQTKKATAAKSSVRTSKPASKLPPTTKASIRAATAKLQSASSKKPASSNIGSKSAGPSSALGGTNSLKSSKSSQSSADGGKLAERELMTKDLAGAQGSSSTLVFGKRSSILSTVSTDASDENRIRKDIIFMEHGEHKLPKNYSLEYFYTTRLGQDQSLRKTATGRKVNKARVRKEQKMFSLKELEAMRRSDALPPDTKLIIWPPFSNLDEIVPGLYLTGICGTAREILREAKIELVVNSTHEMHMLKVDGFISVRVPVDDAPDEPIGLYLDDIADLIEFTRRRGANSVVHCMAGVSRSCSLVLAYLIKYSSLNLHEAFVHVQAIRPPVRPNIGFFQQLIEFELKIRGTTSTKIISVKHPTKNLAVKMPDFYPTEYPKLMEAELARLKNQ